MWVAPRCSSSTQSYGRIHGLLDGERCKRAKHFRQSVISYGFIFHGATIALLLLALSARPAVADSAKPPEIWFFMRGDHTKAIGVDPRQGWQRLFLDPNATWPSALGYVSVIAISDDIPDEMLQKAIDVLNRRHVKLALEVLAQSWVGQPVCGYNVEGYTDPPGNGQIAQRIKAAGGTLSYVTMDGPLYAGHYYDGVNACHSTIQNVADRAAAIIHEYRAAFPFVQVGDTEPFPALPKQPGWKDDYRRWLEAFRQAADIPISFMVMDINWPEDGGRWVPAVTGAADLARSLRQCRHHL